MMLNRYEKYGPSLVDAGFDITPVNGKKPLLKGWTDRPDAAKEYGSYPTNGIGVLCGGAENVIAIDVDVLNVDAARELQTIVEDELGFAPCRIGRAPKFLMLYRCTESMTKQKTGVYDIDGDDSAVEVLAEGQQFVASGIHPDTHKKYQWPQDNIMDVAAADLTLTTPDAVQRVLARCASAMDKFGILKGRVSDRSTPVLGNTLGLKELTAEAAEIEAAVMSIPNSDEHYDDWVQTAHAIKGAMGDTAEAFDLFCKWSESSSKNDVDQNFRLWNSIGTVTNVGAGSIFHWAGEHGFDLGKFRDEHKPKNKGPEDYPSVEGINPEYKDVDELDELDEFDADADIEFPSESSQGDKDNNMGMLQASKIEGPIADRVWLLKDWFPADAVGLLFGQGGVGKTLLIQQLASCVVTGNYFMGIETKQMSVIAVLCEDDEDELSRRQLDINTWLHVDEAGGTKPNDLFIWPRVGEDNTMVTFPSQGEGQAGPFYEELVERIAFVQEKTKQKKTLVILDTAADVFGGNENVRREVNTFIKQYCGSLCTKHGCTVIVLAHPSLTGIASGTGLSGTTGWENSARSRAYFTRDETNDDVRTLSRKKNNYAKISKSTDITVLWDKGVYQLPTTDEQKDIIGNISLKKSILDEIEISYLNNTPYTKREGRKIIDILPKKLGVSAREFAVILGDLVAAEYVSYDRGYKVEKVLV
jgi:hypothetical protein